MSDLGRRMYSQNVVLSGRLDEAGWRRLLLDCIEAMSMTVGGAAKVWHFPTEGGKGGVGLTICQPMTESFCVVDVWPDWDGAYLHVSSCKRFDVSMLVEPIQRAGLAMPFAGGMETLAL